MSIARWHRISAPTGLLARFGDQDPPQAQHKVSAAGICGAGALPRAVRAGLVSPSPAPSYASCADAR
jgi:hypothetical protein